MNTLRKTAIIVGVLFLIAMVTSLVGAGLIESALTEPDYLAAVSSNESMLRLGVLMELIDGVAVVGIAVLMFPIFKKQNEALALGYVGFRVIEAAIIVAAIVSPLALIALSQDGSTTGAAADSLIAMRENLLGQILGIFFGLGALIFYTLVYQLNLVPRFISLWGLAAVVLILVWNLLELLGVHVPAGIVFGLPIILNEIFLGIWLIAKGFNTKEIANRSASAVISPA